LQVDAFQDMQGLSVVVGFVDIAEFDERHFCCISMLLHCKYKCVF
jgi:hypothetical protein